MNNLAPERLNNLFQNSNTTYDYDLRGSSTRLAYQDPKQSLWKSFSFNGAKYVWNHIPEEIRHISRFCQNCQKLSSSTFSFGSRFLWF